ncbi:hypothetical protein [Microtetraspora malaysiensis]|uniref:hypothetical protein n=1 Tax=Microtetraspora malaysiensis TaxID=161358 RepID=UPI000A5D97F8|nr:hypothetical protein [Microtetraspora malaysiensis]
MTNTIMFNAARLASARPAAGVASVIPMRGKAVRVEALAGPVVFGVFADARQGIPAYRPAPVARPMGDEQLNSHITNGGVRGSRYAWREPVTT